MNKRAPQLSSDLLRRRRRGETRFRWYGRAALGLAFLVLVVLVGSIALEGYQGFVQTQIRLKVAFDPAIIDPEGRRDMATIRSADYAAVVGASLLSAFPQVTDMDEQRQLDRLLSEEAAYQLHGMVTENPELIGTVRDVWLPASSDADLYRKGKVDAGAPEADRSLTDKQIGWLRGLEEAGAMRFAFNKGFFSRGDSREPEQAGFLGSIAGSCLTLLVCIGLAFPLGVMTAIYLEEFAQRNRLVDIIEVNINNLAAVPSIIFGLLGLSVYINLMGLPRSAPLVGGLTLALMILPTIIITTRLALATVPASIRDGAKALGASPVQVVFHHVLPLAAPGIMTGTILGMARAIGETAPLLMIGMVAFVADIPGGFTDPATAMPVQVFLWADSPEPGFVEKTSAGILVLLAILILFNSLAIYLRKRYEVRR